jgi:mannose-6-phosphate isomerase-like protein (cupin superfamily)
MGDVTVKRLDEMESIMDGGMVRARASLGATAFGMQVLNMPAGADWYPSHNHAGEPVDDGMEEIYTPLSGSATLIADDEEFALEPGVFARVGPTQKRRIVPGSDGAQILALGAMPGKLYEPPAFTELGAPLPQAPSQ